MTRQEVDDRYRVLQDVESISEALWHVAQDYGTEIATDEQVAIARALRRVLETRSGPLKRQDVLAAFQRFQLRPPRPGFANNMIARLERLDLGRQP